MKIKSVFGYCEVVIFSICLVFLLHVKTEAAEGPEIKTLQEKMKEGVSMLKLVLTIL